MTILITQDAFTGMVAIRISDDLTHQSLALTPSEAAQLREQLNTYPIDGLGDPGMERESQRLKTLTIYNAHSLPSIDRAKFEQNNNLLVTFDFEVIQRIKMGEQVESKVVGKL